MNPLLAPEHAAQPDGDLLQRYLDSRDDVALAELVRRHAPLVRGVCQRILGDSPDADDAFQATFLVLIRCGERIRKPQSLAAWLFGTAHRIARRQRTQRAQPVQSLREEQAMVASDPLTELANRHDVALFDAELARLPEKYRAPIVLHHLEGKSQREVAAELQLTEGAVDGLLKRGRNELRVRLAKRGVIFGVTLAAIQTSQTAVAATTSESLITATVKSVLSLDPGLHPEFPHTPAAQMARQELTMFSVLHSTKAVFWTLAGTILFGGATVGLTQALDRHEARLEQDAAIASVLPMMAESQPATPEMLLAAADSSVGISDESNSEEKNEDETAATADDEFKVVGSIERVDQDAGKVYLNVGSADRIRDRMRFAVRAESDGVENASAEMKATIEIMTILGKHSSVAKINTENIGQPIAVGDEIGISKFTAAAFRRRDLFSVGSNTEKPEKEAEASEPPRPSHFRRLRPKEKHIYDALQQETEVSFVDTSLRDALDYLEQLHKFDVIINEKEINDDGASADVQINLELSGVTLESALNLTLKLHDLDYIIKDEVLMITTINKADEYLELRVYDIDRVKPLLGDFDFDDEKAMVKARQAVTKAVGGSWDEEGGAGTIAITPNGLVVRQNQRTHREIENLLEQLRRANAEE